LSLPKKPLDLLAFFSVTLSVVFALIGLAGTAVLLVGVLALATPVVTVGPWDPSGRVIGEMSRESGAGDLPADTAEAMADG